MRDSVVDTKKSTGLKRSGRVGGCWWGPWLGEGVATPKLLKLFDERVIVNFEAKFFKVRTICEWACYKTQF